MKNSNKFYIILFVFGLMSLALVVFLILPIIKEIKKNSEDLISAKNNTAALEEQIKETEKFKNNYESYKPNFEKITQVFVDPENPVEFIKFLENSAASLNITSKISFQSNSFQFYSQGAYLDELNFLKKIEEGPYLIEIGNLSIENQQEKKQADVSFLIKALTNQ